MANLRLDPPPYTFNKGKIPQEALDQGTWWRSRSGKLFRITDMHPMHAQRAMYKLWGMYPGHKSENSALWAALRHQAGQYY